ncbi:MAG: ABC transporter permease [Acidimicrobiia bacterium]|nr:ABC transporter permease [Acidimicrobiia bacterium]
MEQTYEEDRQTPVPLRWFAGGHIVQSTEPGGAPLLLFGADAFGRDVFSRTLYGGRWSLDIAVLAALGALCLGVFVGSMAGYRGGLWDDVLMRTSDMVMVLPTMYVVMVLRAALPLVLSSTQMFVLLVSLFSVVGAPIVARAVLAVVRSERALEYAAAAESLGASPLRILIRHLLPAATGIVLIELMTLLPGFVVAEATLSYVGFGFPDTVPTWGTMLHEASSVRVLADFPWLFAPAIAIFLVVLGVNASIRTSHAGLGAGLDAGAPRRRGAGQRPE